MEKPFQKSFTLMEMIIYLAVFSIIIVVILAFIFWFINANAKSKAMRETLMNARKAMEIIIHEINSASSIYTPTTSTAQISLETLNYLPTGEYTSYIDIYKCGLAVCLKKESQNPEALTSESINVDNLSFTKILTGSIYSFQIILDVSYNNPSSQPQYQAAVSLTSTAALRGY